MIFYHFCSNKHAPKIFKEGITIGGVLNPATMQMHDGYMWITTDPDPSHQSWATRQLIPYSRTAWRIELEIPDEYEYRIYDRDKLAELFPGTEPLFDGWKGSECWRVYKGEIPVKWITAIERME